MQYAFYVFISLSLSHTLYLRFQQLLYHYLAEAPPPEVGWAVCCDEREWLTFAKGRRDRLVLTLT